MPSLLRFAAVFVAFSTPALAGELDVRIEPGAVAPTAVTYLDVTAGPLSSLTFRAADGVRYRLDLTVDPAADDIVGFDARVHQVKVKRNGSEKVKLLSESRLETSDGSTALLEFPLPGPDAGVLKVTLSPRLDPALNRPEELR